jgi:signal peptidase I
MASRTSKIIIGSIAVVLLAPLPALVLVKAFFITYYRIPQNGMYPSLPSGSLFFATRRPYAAPSEVKRGDIVVFTRGEGRYNYVWRVIGLPGDTIEAARASLVINGQPVARELLREERGMAIFRERAGEAAYEVAIDQSPRDPPPDASGTVPADHFFVMGDNRLNAHDSRSFGPIPFGTIIGRKL